jgi:hypothetical protein
MAETQTDRWLGIARDAYSESTTFFDAGVRREIEEDLRRFYGLHPSGSKYLSPAYAHRSRFFRPRTRAAIRKHEAIAASALFGNADWVSLEPEDQQDKLQVASAAFWQHILDRRLQTTIPWFQLSLGAYQDAMATGVCVSYQHWKFDKLRNRDEPCISLMPVENVRFSPRAEWFDPVRTSPYFIRMIPMMVGDVLDRTRKVDPKTGQPKWKTIEIAEITKAAKSYSDSVTMIRNQGRADSQHDSAITEFSPVWVHQNFVEINGRHVVYYTLADVQMLTEPRDLEELYFHGERPFVVGNCVIETHKLYPAGDARLAKDIQAELNENANQRSDNVKFAMNKRYWVKRSAQVDLRALMRNVPGGATLMNDPEKDVREVDTQDVTRSAYEEQDRLNLDFDDLIGSFSQASVQANRNLNETATGMELLTNDSSQMGAYQLKVWTETWVKPVLRQLLKLEQHYETDTKLFQLAVKKAGKSMISDPATGETFPVDEALLMQELDVRVNVGLGATSPQVKLNNLMGVLRQIKEILMDGILVANGLDVRELINEAFSKAGYDGGARFFRWGDDDPRVEALQKELEALKQELANKKDPPQLVEAKVRLAHAQADKLEGDKAEGNVRTIFGAMQGAEVVATTPAVAPVADQILRAAGYQEPVPAGIDPGFAPGEQGPDMLAIQDMAAGAPPGSGLDRELPGNVDPSTNPMTPSPPAAPASPMTGANGGIETMRSDSEGPDQ